MPKILKETFSFDNNVAGMVLFLYEFRIKHNGIEKLPDFGAFV